MTKKLKTLIYLSVPLLVAHSLEEYLTGFYGWSPGFKRAFTVVTADPILAWLVMMWVAFGFVAIMVVSERWRFYGATLPALLFSFELHHWVEFIIAPHYKGGDGTAVLIPMFLGFYWREWWKNLRTTNDKP